MSGTFDPSFIHALKGTTFDFLNSSDPWAVEEDAEVNIVPATGQIVVDEDPRQTAQERVQVVTKLSTAARPFSAGEGSRSWLEEASTPMVGFHDRFPMCMVLKSTAH